LRSQLSACSRHTADHTSPGTIARRQVLRVGGDATTARPAMFACGNRYAMKSMATLLCRDFPTVRLEAWRRRLLAFYQQSARASCQPFLSSGLECSIQHVTWEGICSTSLFATPGLCGSLSGVLSFFFAKGQCRRLHTLFQSSTFSLVWHALCWLQGERMRHQPTTETTTSRCSCPQQSKSSTSYRQQS